MKNKSKKYFEDNKDIWQEINLKKIPVYYFTKETANRFFACRESINTTFNKKKIEEKLQIQESNKFYCVI